MRFEKIAEADEPRRAEHNRQQNGRHTAPGHPLLPTKARTSTIQKRFDKIGVENTEANRRDYRELLFRCAERRDEAHLGGAILYDETIRQKTPPTATSCWCR